MELIKQKANLLIPTFLAMVVTLILYGLPTILELGLLRLHLSATFCCVVLSDVPGAVVLYLVGLRKTGVTVYLIATAVEALLLRSGMRVNQLALFTNAVPALAAGVALFTFTLQFISEFEA